jgi:hypothetical protein
MPLTIEERKAVATIGRLADALNNFAEQGKTMARVYDQALVNETDIADYINKRQEEVGAVITIDYIERNVPTSALNTMRRVVYHYDKKKG